MLNPAALPPAGDDLAAAVPRFFEVRGDASAPSPRDEIIEGLTQPKARLSPKFFYDVLGSHLFEAITELDEYYPTRAEAAILARRRREIAASVGSGASLVDLGAGNCAKAASLFESIEPARYIAVDISVDFVRRAVERLATSYPHIVMSGVGMDFSTSLDLPPALQQELAGAKPLFFYPGSSIGNFTPSLALAFLRRIQSQAAGGGLLIGVDLVKPADVLQRAYDDSVGVTAAFNRNVLRNVNRILDSDFDPSAWRHVALFNEVLSRVEMHLEAMRPMCIRWPGGERTFEAGERIHTESAFKYTVERFDALLREAGFRAVRHWRNDEPGYAIFHAVN